MLFRDLFHVYEKFHSLQSVLKFALKSQPDSKFLQKYGTQGDLFLKLAQAELQQFTSDPEWVKAKTLSDSIRNKREVPVSHALGGKKTISSTNGSKRHFSTLAPLFQEGQSDKKKV